LAINLKEQIEKQGAGSLPLAFFKSRMLVTKAEYLGATGKLKEAEETFDTFKNSEYYKNPLFLVEIFNY